MVWLWCAVLRCSGLKNGCLNACDQAVAPQRGWALYNSEYRNSGVFVIQLCVCSLHKLEGSRRAPTWT
jgi:hypothetical protein